MMIMNETRKPQTPRKSYYFKNAKIIILIPLQSSHFHFLIVVTLTKNKITALVSILLHPFYSIPLIISKESK